MDRRRALGLVAAFPGAMATQRAAACSIAVESAESYAARLPQVARLFSAWFARDELGLLGPIMGPRTEDPGPQHEDMIRRAIDANPDQEPRRLFDTLFTAPDRYRSLITMTAVGESVLVAIDEASPGGIEPDCSGMPTMRLFLLGWQNGRPASLRMIEERIWSGQGQTAHWSV